MESQKPVKTLSRTLITASLLLLAIAGYYGWELQAAYRYTIDRVIPQESAAPYPLTVSSLTANQQAALLKIEDPNFYHHSGIDLKTPGAGITTITQALVKKIYFERFTPGIAKIKQTLLARFVLDPLMSKEKQLRRFINTVYLGPNAKGFEQAAHHYFNRSFDEISDDQFLALVAMIIAPETFNINKHPARNKLRVARLKHVINGDYEPKGLFDLYYGRVDRETLQNLPPLSYFESYYQ
ncbi:MAG: transglycosylase domain-containing protein [Candidatus Thiodiazotropha lotti]|nr:transglycosylase domain-containing protein [Candidatus Thiodiazotropha lotti]MCG7923139.1 transglycosylase domain-containing protein [Candidatus Thiodiazotropha lotti]MCG8003001.1 transglycosylase domain-containing protein [Candidatus Thiodiazotropha lotti]MCG8008629.1 transglycosylase domain-containing protein [Candidatus Thiodiazotropha lotti]MCW4186622.1 transglycosylase domain-containing protein [Candidatus Thiodiazotropha lotti]